MSLKKWIRPLKLEVICRHCASFVPDQDDNFIGWCKMYKWLVKNDLDAEVCEEYLEKAIKK